MATVKKPIKKAQSGASLEERRAARKTSDSIRQVKLRPAYEKRYQAEKKPGQTYDQWQSADWERVKENSFKAKAPKGERTFFSGDNGPKSPCKGGSCAGENTRSKNGSSIKKAKDGMWMQKAAASIKKRGTAGKCTPITKPGCTGRAKALAKTFKKIAKSNKKK